MPKKILIIDDETDFCLIMKSYMERKGYEVHMAYTLGEGLAEIERLQPDILVLDNNLPDGNGWEALESIVEKIPQIQAYLVSAHRNYSPLNEVYKNLVIWEKPISMEQLNRFF